MIESRKSEIRFVTSDPKRMLGKWLSNNEKKRVKRMQELYDKHQSEIEPTDDEARNIIAAIEQVKPIPISRYIPLEFSMVYNDEQK